MFKIAFGIAFGVCEYYSIGSCSVICYRNNDHLLHSSVYNSAVNKVSRWVVESNVHIAEVLIKIEVNGIVSCSRFNVIRTSTVIQPAQQCNSFCFRRNVVAFLNHTYKYLLWVLCVEGLCAPNAEPQGVKAYKK